ncbi:Exodeoxyribonuclease VII large subunit [Oceanospirillum multiglobuliferum]|nr:exodeoxyribonuclease VII large subunit [Oceanospirillum multiglobuliferum]SJZ63618.1 Exodeoxyribonuclease VII large subunit [Oceanospirillum multiglobuliferum]
MQPASPSLSNIGRPVLTVTQLNQKARQLLEGQFSLVIVEGEISNLSIPSSGHLYFSLKDEQSQVRCALFRNRAQLLAFKPQNGDKVQLYAKASLFEGRGDFQLIAETMEQQGRGALIRAFEALKFRLQSEGLFETKHKQALPPIPNTIGVITSTTGAAIQDILTVLERRFPLAEIIIYPTLVQGSEAPNTIARAIELANLHDQADLLIVGRGGGSLEDLWAFNDERVARAIFASFIPIVSAIGHETDTTIADYVADLRAPTPSAAAELISPDLEQWLNWLTQAEKRLIKVNTQLLIQQQQRLDYLEQRFKQNIKQLEQQKQQLVYTEQRLHRALAQQIQQYHHRLSKLELKLRHPQTQLNQQHSTLKQLSQRLEQAFQQQMHRQQAQFSDLSARLWRASPVKPLNQQQQKLAKLHQSLQRGIRQQLLQQEQKLAQIGQQLQIVSPLATLSRGYAIVQDDEQQIIRHYQQVKLGDTINIRLADGELVSVVQAQKP